MALLLYDNPASSNALKARILLAELGLEYERRTVPFDRPRPDWYLAVNPVGGIPALDDDGLVVAESNAILRYLAAREGRTDLYPAEPRERAPVETALDRWSLTFRPALRRHEIPALAGDHEEAARVADEIAPILALLDRLVHPSGAWLGRYTIADVAAAPALHRTRATGLDLSPWPNVERWRETVTARPAFAAAGPVG